MLQALEARGQVVYGDGCLPVQLCQRYTAELFAGCVNWLAGIQAVTERDKLQQLLLAAVLQLRLGLIQAADEQLAHLNGGNLFGKIAAAAQGVSDDND